MGASQGLNDAKSAGHRMNAIAASQRGGASMQSPLQRGDTASWLQSFLFGKMVSKRFGDTFASIV
jgi:hypothetical protein